MTRTPTRPALPSSDAMLAKLRGGLAGGIDDERRSQRLTLRQLGEMALVAPSVVHEATTGGDVSLETYVRLLDALEMRLDVAVRPARRRPADAGSDIVHSAMGELEAAHFRHLLLPTAIDEPYQHYQFAGRGDVLAWHLERRALLHIENRTRFPNIQEVAGSYNAKRAYLGVELARRLGIDRWRSETHALVALWSGEVLHALRMRLATIRSLCPDPIDGFAGWWNGELPEAGTQSMLVILDPAPAIGRRRRFVGIEGLATVEPRYRDYRSAAEALRPAAEALRPAAEAVRRG